MEFVKCRSEAGARYVVGAGCEIPRGTPPDNFRAIVDFARGKERSQALDVDQADRLAAGGQG